MMLPTIAWLLLRIPREPTATSMSGVLGVGDSYVTTAEGPDMSTVCDRLLEAAKVAGQEYGLVILVDPLDGRHDLAQKALDEANRRGWRFARHVPRGAELYLLDLEGADAAPTLAKNEIPALFDKLSKEIQAALQRSELAEALAVLRRMLAIGLRHLGAWHPDTYWAASNLMRFASGTGAVPNVEQAAGLIEHLLKQPFPAQLENAPGLLRKLDETARDCAKVGLVELAARLAEASIAVARQAFGERSPDYLGAQNNACVVLTGIRSPKAEPALRELLRSAKEVLGERHPNIAVVLNNLANAVEVAGRLDEATALREEAAHISKASASPA